VTAEIISIGDELLIGQVVNTNASWMAVEFNLAGISILQITTVADDRNHIMSALEAAAKRADIILLTGGLGPTKDDITKQILCEYFNTRLVMNMEVYDNIFRLFGSRGMELGELNRKQAEVPEACLPIPNLNGTAPGMWFEKEGKIYVSMPGVPYEMKEMVKNSVIPWLLKKFRQEAIVHKTIMTYGVPESALAKKLENWEDNLPENVKLAYLPQPGAVRLRLTAKGEQRTLLEQQVADEISKLKQIIPDDISAWDDEPINETIGKLLRERQETLSTAESCTGGYVAHLITLIPGSSDYFKGGVIAYANEIKESTLGVNHQTITNFGAVSEQVVKEMAEGIRKKTGTDYAIATSGIAGPDGGTPEKPVGTTWISIASKERTVAEHFLMGEHRERNVRKTALTALNMLRKIILTHANDNK
jgi:nicotinamide-nucleotide amidase